MIHVHRIKVQEISFKNASKIRTFLQKLFRLILRELCKYFVSFIDSTEKNAWKFCQYFWSTYLSMFDNSPFKITLLKTIIVSMKWSFIHTKEFIFFKIETNLIKYQDRNFQISISTPYKKVTKVYAIKVFHDVNSK